MIHEPNAPAAPDAEPVASPRKPRVALMGEFSAGKSTLSNMLLGEEPFPVKVTATRLPPVWARHGERASFAVDHEGNETPLDLDDLGAVDVEETAYIGLQRETDILELCDLIDMPGVSDPNMPAEVWLKMIEEVDLVIWCTHANQAWRQSEAAIWERIMGQTTGDNILLVTQIDKIRSERDRARVMTRVRKETDGLFQAVYPVSLLTVLQAGDDFEMSQEGGTAAFLEHLVEILLKPVVHRQKPAMDWDVMPELPEMVQPKRVASAPVAGGAEQGAVAPAEPAEVMPAEAAPADPGVDAAAVVPRRVRRPSAENRPRPPRSEVTDG